MYAYSNIYINSHIYIQPYIHTAIHRYRPTDIQPYIDTAIHRYSHCVFYLQPLYVRHRIQQLGSVEFISVVYSAVGPTVSLYVKFTLYSRAIIESICVVYTVQ